MKLCYIDESGGFEAEGSHPTEPGLGLDPDSSYTYAIQDMARHFDHLLLAEQDIGLLICDSRMPSQNRQVSHSVFTLKHRYVGDALPELVETPVFGVSDNHAGIQLADIIAGTLLLQMACRTYCQGSLAPTHMDPKYDRLAERYAHRLRRLQYLYRDAMGRSRGGVVVSDRRGGRASRHLFAAPVALAQPEPVTA